MLPLVDHQFITDFEHEYQYWPTIDKDFDIVADVFVAL